MIVKPSNNSVTKNKLLNQSNQSILKINTISNKNVSSVTTPRNVSVDVNNVLNIPEKNNNNISLFIKGLLALLILCGVATAIYVPILFLVQTPIQDSGKSENISNSTITTSTTTQVTTTVTCPSGYVQTSSGTCVNTQIDFYNCGSVGYICPSNYTSCSVGICSARPAVQLVGAIGVPGFNSSISGIDDTITSVSLAVSITLYNYTTNNVTVSSNGVLCLDSCNSDYSNGNLPSSSFGGPTVFGLWDDLIIYTGTSQAIYYGISGLAPNRTTTFEFYESSYSSSSQYYHFQIIFNENSPNIVTYKYFQMTDGGVSATIGLQQSSSGPCITYSVNQANAVSYNTTLVFNTNTGTFTG